MAKEEKTKTPPEAEQTAPEVQQADAPETAQSEENAAEQKLQELENNLKEANDKFLRTLAEYDNYRKLSVR